MVIATVRVPLTQQLRAWLSQSIAHRITFAAASLSGGFVIVIGLLSFVMTQSLMRDSIRAKLHSEAELVGERVAHELTASAKSIAALAQSSLVSNALVDSSGRTSYLEPFLGEFQLTGEAPFSLALTDHAGRLIAGNRKGLILPKPEAWIRRQVEKNQAHAEILGGVQSPLLLAYPVIFPGTSSPEGMLLLELPLQPLLQNSVKGVVDERGVELKSGARSVFAASDASADSARVAIEWSLQVPPPIKQLDLRLRRSRSWMDAYGVLVYVSVIYSAVALAALLLAMRLARSTARRMVAPLQTLTAVAERNRADDSVITNFPVSGQDEVAQLGASLQHMVEQLRAEHELLEQRVAERTAELNDLAYIVRRTSNGVIVTDPQGRVEWVNEGFVRITGYTLEELRGKKPGDVLQGAGTDPAVIRDMGIQLAKGEGFAVELLNYHKNGIPYWVSIDAQPIRDDEGRIIKFVALEADITERKRVDQLKSDFVSVVSHELRTPLTAIRGALGLLAGGALGELSATASDMAHLALSNSERLTRLINDLLDIQKLESGKMQFDMGTFRLPRLLQEALAANQPYAQKYKVKMAIEGEIPDVALEVDEGRFQQILANLLSNAAKFSPEGDEVSIAVSGPDNQWIDVSVKDRGPGIPEEFRARVFQKFSQADSSNTRAKDGTGLGLSITKALVEGMGGHIKFASVPGQGTVFTVSLPLTPVTS